MVKVFEYDQNMVHIIQLLISTQPAGRANIDSIPANGFLVYNDATPVACGFLRLVEGGFAQIDTMVTNATSSKEVRHECLNILVDTLIERGKQLGLKGLLAMSSDHGIINRADAVGFHIVPQTILAMPLNVTSAKP